jgi:hypothetical protein
MAFLNGLFSRRQAPSPRELEKFVRTVVELCEPTVWDRVEGRTSRMSPAEARGYIRARCAAVVHEQVEQALRKHPNWPTTLRTEVLERTADDTVREVHHRLLNLRHPIVERRQAA